MAPNTTQRTVLRRARRRLVGVFGLATVAMLLVATQGNWCRGFASPSSRPSVLGSKSELASLSTAPTSPRGDAATVDSAVLTSARALGGWWRSASMAGAALLCAVLVGIGSPSGFSGDGQGLQWGPQPAYAAGSFASGERVNRDPVSLLQYALPLEETLGDKKVESIRTIQSDIEGCKGDTLLRLWAKANGQINDATQRVQQQKDALLKPVDASRKEKAQAVLKELQTTLPALSNQLQIGSEAGAGTEKDKEVAKAALELANKAQKQVGDLEELYIPPGYAAPIADDVDKSLPQLQGRAVVELVLTHDPKDTSAPKFDVDAELFDEAKLKIVVDGWSAPVNAGAFVEMIDKGFYNGMPLQRADGFIIQTGDPGPEKGNGYKPDPEGKVRRLPLEVGLKGRKMALYGETVDDANVVGETLRIPFSADGTLAMARSENDNDSASSQFFLFVFEPDMTPPGKNFLDGRYSNMGYTIEGDRFLRQMREGDIVKSAKVLDGLQNLRTKA